jgi:hypothetical protein
LRNLKILYLAGRLRDWNSTKLHLNRPLVIARSHTISPGTLAIYLRLVNKNANHVSMKHPFAIILEPDFDFLLIK